jgi:hypothetical protein
LIGLAGPSVKSCHVIVKRDLDRSMIGAPNDPQSFADPRRYEFRRLSLFAVQREMRHLVAIVGCVHKECTYSTKVLEARWT